MASISDLMLEVEKINESIIPVIKLLAEIRERLIELILEKLIILPDFSFSPEEEKHEEGKISRNKNFQEFIKNLNFYFYTNFYTNIKITEENFQKYLEEIPEIPAESLPQFSALSISGASADSLKYRTQISLMYEKAAVISEAFTQIPEFMEDNADRIYEISGAYEKADSEEKEKISSKESKTEQNNASVISQLYEKIAVMTTAVPEFMVNNSITAIASSEIPDFSSASEKPEAEEKDKEKISSPESKAFSITNMPAISRMYEEIYKVSEVFTKFPGWTADNAGIISGISGISEKPEAPEKNFPEYKTSQENTSAISQVRNKIGEISTAYAGTIVNIKEKFEESEYIKAPENTVSASIINCINSMPEMRETFEGTEEKISKYFNTINYLTKSAETAAVSGTGTGSSYTVNMQEMNEKINFLSQASEYSREIVEKTENAIFERSMLNNVYGHDKEAGFLDALASFETAKIEQILPLISALTPQTSPSAKASRTTNNTFNITITAKSISEDRDLKELGKKIGMILAEEVRRSGEI